jgi:predicted extracellular nuclease/2',3'-cyclic-nucleotide 2'-phosphodiesterase (5'-nucleotidase family)
MTTTRHILANGDFSQDWSNTGLIVTSDDWNGVPSIVGYRGDELVGATGVDPRTITAASSSGGVVDVNANQTNPSTFATGGVAEFDTLTDPTIALNGSGTADAPSISLFLDATGRSDVRVRMNLRDLDASTDDATQQVAVQYRVAGGNWQNVAYVADATSAGAATLVTAVDVTLGSDANNAADLEVRVITTNAVGNDEWVGVDDILVSSSPAGGVVAANVTINDVAVVEGNSGTTNLVFTVTRSNNEGSFTVDYATANGTATAGSDYVAANGTLNFVAGGALSQQITVTITGDTDVEPNEGFTVALSNLASTLGSAVLSDASGAGTITNDDVGAAITLISAIQGAGHISPLVGQSVTTTGIVTAVDSNGFFLQSADADADADIATSEGIFVFTSSAPTVSVGQAINVTGTVSEFTPGGTGTGNLSTTQLGGPLTIAVLSSGNALPTAVVLGAGGRQLPTANIDDDGLTSFDPVTDGIDFFESLEGMLVTVPSPRAVSPTNQFGEIYTVADNGAAATNLTPRGSIIIEGTVGDGLNVTNTGAGSDFNPERIQIDPDSTITPGVVPLVDVGAVLNDVIGVIGYNFGNFEVIPTAAVTVRTASTLAPETTTLAGSDDVLTIATYNVLNLDPGDAPTGRFTTIAQQIVNRLGAPDIVALQEVQDNNGATNNGTVSASMTLQMLVDAIAANGGPTYTFVDNPFITNNANGGEPGGNIRTAFLYQADRVSLESLATTTDPADQASNPVNPFFDSRLPLVGTFEFNGQDVVVINNHFSSKGGGTPLFGTTQPSVNGSAAQRLAQADNVADFVESLGHDAKVVVLGDLNEFTNEESLAPLFAAGLEDLAATLPKTDRYSFMFDGNAQALDQTFVSSNLADVATYDIVHVNIEFGFTSATASDHDPSVVALTLPEVTNVAYTLQLLHFADAEAGLLASSTAKYLAANVDAFEDDFANSITLAGGDNFIPGPFLAAGTDLAVRATLNALTGSTMAGQIPIAAADIALHNLIGVQASTIGNHEFDLGSNVFRNSFTPNSGWVGADFPYLSANLDFSADSDLSTRFTTGGQEASSIKGRIAPTAVITEGGEKIGLVAVTTQILEAISSPSGTEVLGFPVGPGANGEADNMVLLASQIQPLIDGLIASGVNKIVLMSHLQILNNERTLAELLTGVDIILAAGSNTRLGDADDVAIAFPGHSANFADTYPIVTAGADGKTTVIVNTDNEFTYLGRLVVDFDANGEIITDSLAANVAINGAYASTAENVAAAWGTTVDNLDSTAFAAGTRGDRVEALTDAVQSVINVKDGNVFGWSNVYLNGERISVRNQETNLGNITADANADALRDALGAAAPEFIVSLKNGGGIRAQIGSVSAPDPIDGTVDFLAPGTVSQLDIENSLRFNNGLIAFDTTAAGLKAILEHGVAALGNQGRFPQIGGVAFSFDPDLAAGSRVLDIALVREDGTRIGLFDDGVALAGAPATITVVTLNFLANGGDGYPIKANGENFRFLLNDGTLSAPVDEALNFTATGVVPLNLLGEQQAMGEYLAERFATPETAYNEADTAIQDDTRIQNLNFRAADTVLLNNLTGTQGDDVITGTSLVDIINGLAGNDTINGGDGDDVIDGGLGNDRIDGGAGIDTASFATATGSITVNLGTGAVSGPDGERDTLLGIENLLGSAFDDLLVGSIGDNVIEGGAGNDVLRGARGNDTLIDGLGNDIFEGGVGVDIFRFDTISDGAVDIITDFSASLDTLELGAGITVAGVSVSFLSTSDTVNGVNVGNGARSLDLVVTLQSAEGTQTLHILDSYGFANNSYWEGVLGVDLGYPRPLPTGTELLPIA